MYNAHRLMMFSGRGDLPPFAENGVLFLRSDKGVITDGSGNVTRWVNQFGGDDAVPRPSLPAMTYDGVSVNGTDAGNERLQVGAAGDYSFLSDGTGGSVYVVMSYNAGGDGLRPIFATNDAGLSTASAGMYMAIDDSAPEDEAILTQVVSTNGAGITLINKTANDAGVSNVFSTYTYRLDSTTPNLKIDRDGTNFASVNRTGGIYAGTAIEPLTLNAIGGTGFSSVAQYKAFLIYNVKHTDAEAAQVRQYLADRFRRVNYLGGSITQNVVVKTTDDATAVIEAQTGTRNSMTQVVLKDGTHSLSAQADVPNWVGVTGTSRANTIVEFHQPDSASASDIATFSAFDPDENCFLRDMTVTVENARYGVHPEILANCKQWFYNLDVKHLGNPSLNNTWSERAQNGFGCGTRTNSSILIQNCTVEGQERAITMHNNIDFNDPSEFIIRNCVLNSALANPTQLNVAFSQDIVGSGIGAQRQCRYTVEDCTGEGGSISYEYFADTINTLSTSKYTLNPDEAYYMGDFNNRYINSPTFWFAGNDGASSLRYKQEAIKISSTDTSETLPVTVTGDMTIFGNDYTGGALSKAMGGGIGSYVHGTFDVSANYKKPEDSVSLNQLGRRLGDCSGGAKTFTLTQGTVSETVTLDQDYTSDSNAQVLTAINNQLTNFNAETYNFMRDYFPVHDGVTLLCQNTGSKSVRMGHGAKILSNTTARIAVQADDSAIGIWVDETPVGGYGRVLYRSQGSFNYIREAISGFPADNTDIGIGATDGVFVTSPTNASFRTNGTASIPSGNVTLGLEFLLGYTPT